MASGDGSVFHSIGADASDLIDEAHNDLMLRVTRRAFIGGATSLPAVSALAAGGERVYMDIALRFERSLDRRHVVIRIVEQPLKQEKETDSDVVLARRLSDHAWFLDALSFGPEAVFELTDFGETARDPRPGERTRPRYVLRVRNARYGRYFSDEMSFEFMRRTEPAGQPKWRLRAVTDLWPGDAGAFSLGAFGEASEGSQQAAPVDLRAFLENKAHLEQYVSRNRITKTLRYVFNGLAGWRDGRAGKTDRLRLRLDADATWRLDQSWISSEPIAEVLAPGLKVGDLRLGWAIPDGRQGGALIVSPKDAPTEITMTAPRKEDRFASDLPEGAVAGVVAYGTPDPEEGASITIGRRAATLSLTRLDGGRTEPVILRVRDPSGPGDPDAATVRGVTVPRTAEAGYAAHWVLAGTFGGARIGAFANLSGPLRRKATISRQAAGGAATSFLHEMTFGAAFEEEKPRRIDSRLGPLTVAGIVSPEKSETDADPRNPFGDFTGLPVRVAARRNGSRFNQPADLTWFEATCHLLEASPQLERASFSQLRFDASELNMLYAPRLSGAPLRGSFIRLDTPTDGGPVARLDLSRAQLRAARATDLASLTFRFANLALHFAPDAGQILPEIVSFTDQCVALAGAGEIARELPSLATGPASDRPARPQGGPASGQIDARPVLVVEFPPQHVMERAWLMPATPPLPEVKTKTDAQENAWFLIGATNGPKDTFNVVKKPAADSSEVGSAEFSVAVNDREAILRLLAALKTIDLRAKARQLIATTKTEDPVNDNDRKAFKAFAAAFKDELKAWRPKLPGRRIPADQQIFIGPYALDADASIVARKAQRRAMKETLKPLVDRMFAEIVDQANRALKNAGTGSAIIGHAGDFRAALALERVLEATTPAYQQFRAFYREWMTERIVTGDPGFQIELAPQHIEYVAAIPGTGNRAWEGAGILAMHEKAVIAHYLDQLGTPSEIGGSPGDSGIAEGRHSAPSRLAFRVNCRDGLALARRDVREFDLDDEERVGLGRGPMAFSLDALTDWSSLELSVVRRAQNVYLPGVGGRLDAKSGRRLDLSLGGRLAHLGFQSGEGVTAADRLADIETSLVDAPDPWQTDIVLPSRLSLSTSQSAVFLTPRPVPAAIFAEWPSTAEGEAVIWPDQGDSAPLWAARLFTDDLDPGLRAVHSPDLRPGFVWSALSERDAAAMVTTEPDGSLRALKRIPGNGPPPGGPIAPWLIGPEETTARNETTFNVARAIAASTDLDETTRKKLLEKFAELNSAPANDRDVLLCSFLDEQRGDGTPLRLPTLIDQMCRRLLARRDPKAFWRKRRTFRTPLSANDRHQLVVLSSAHGLPVMGRRDLKYNLVAGSSQAEPDERFRIGDLAPGDAVYRPRALEVSELALTALGGSLRHDTNFEPPASARHISKRALFDALSIERWQHWTVLGRDVFAEVVYKGFLFPLGHRASLVKVTERTFLRDANTHLIRAYLRQRIFIRCGKPEKLFPALEQPNGGRGFKGRTRVEILTTQTPDIVDPYSGGESKPGTVSANGRIILTDVPGLAFWPRVAQVDGAEVRFEIEFDGAFVDLPLIFVDNVAANSESALTELAKYYNALTSPDDGPTGANQSDLVAFRPEKHMRSIATRGQKFVFCQELKTGTATYETDLLTLRVEGRERYTPKYTGGAVDPVATYKFANNNFAFTPVLQGADQPPFYPVIESARLLLRRNERLTGRRARAVRAIYDGNYLAYGLPVPRSQDGVVDDATAEARALVNGMQIFMSLMDQPSQDMGAKGDQSGGLFRPAGRVIGLSRSKGLVTSANPVAPLYKALTQIDGDFRLSIAEFKTTATPDEEPGSALAKPTVAGRARVNSELKKLKQKAESIYKSLMSSDAKLLGLVEMGEILQFLGDELQDPENGAPELLEKIRYGAQQAGDSAENLTDLVRQRVVKPLASVVNDLRVRWDTIGRTIAEKQGIASGITEPITLEELFPELDAGLDGLDGALQRALQVEDDIEFAFELAEVFEAGQAFLAAVQATASSPVARFETALKKRFADVRSFAEGIFDEIQTLGRELGQLIKGELPKLVAELLVPKSEAGPYRWVYLPTPTPRIAGDRDPGSWSGEIEKVQKALDKIHLTDVEAREIVTFVIAQLLYGVAPEKIVDRPFWFDAFTHRRATPLHVTIRELLKGRAEEAKADLITIAQTLAEEEAKKLAAQAIAALDRYAHYLEQQAAGFRREYEREISFVLAVWARAAAIRKSLGANDYQLAGRETFELIQMFTGKIEFSVERICKQWNVGDILVTAARAIEFRDTDAQKYVAFPFADPKLKDGADYDEDEIREICERGDLPDLFILPTTPEERANDPVTWRIADLHGDLVKIEAAATGDKIKAARQKIVEFRDNQLPDDDEFDQARGATNQLLITLNFAASETKKKAFALRKAVADQFCALQIDALRLQAFEGALHGLITELVDPDDPSMTVDLCQLGRVAEALRELPTTGRQFIEGRKELVEGTAENLRKVIATLKEFVENPEVQRVAAAGVVGAAIDRLRDSLPDDVLDEVHELRQEIEALRTELKADLDDLKKAVGRVVLKAVCLLIDCVERLERTVGRVHAEGVRLKTLVDRAIAQASQFGLAISVTGLEQNLETIGTLKTYLNSVAKTLKSELPGDKTAPDAVYDLEKLKNLKVIGTTIPVLDFASVEFSAGSNGKIEDAIKRMEAALAETVASLEALGREWLGTMRDKVLKKLDPVAMTILTFKLRGAADPDKPGVVHELYRKLYIKRAEAIAVAPNAALEAALSAALKVTPRPDGPASEFNDADLGVLAPPVSDPPAAPFDRLERDTLILQKIVADKAPISTESHRRFLAMFLREWGNGFSGGGDRATPIVIISQLGDILTELIRGDFLQLIDLNAVRTAIEDYILSLVPTEFELGYTFSTPMSSKMKDVTAGIFEPGDGSRFSVRMQIVIKLARSPDGRITPTLEFKSIGEIGRFNINLVGSFDCVTLIFGGARFISESGGKSTFKVDYEDFRIGKQLDFVQKLQSSFFPGKDGTGFYIEPRFSPIGVEAGYALDLGIISIGNVSFFNVSVGAAAILPFEDAEARFKGSLSRRWSPFTISYAPYGGSGFFSIEANARGIVGFEAAFEFGGAAAFGFGPLTGQGRLMAGIYIRQQTLPNIGKVTEISGTFFVGGTASIWIFSFGASLYVRLGMINGNMSGEAIFTYSFSIGIKDFDFSITVFKKEGKGFQNQQQASLSPELRRTLYAGTDSFDLAALGHPGGLPAFLRGEPEIRKNVERLGKNWRGFCGYFDQDLEDPDKFEIEDGF